MQPLPLRLLSKAQKEAGCTEFEIFNEPDLDGAMGCPTVHDGLTTDWKAPNCQYFKMFREAALAIKRVDKRLLVGGPATSGCRWLESLSTYVSMGSAARRAHPGSTWGG